MAKVNMTLEEKLNEAIVKEAPYEVPKKWVWTKLGKVCNKVQYGYTEKASAEKVGTHFLRITDIQENRVDWSSVPYCPILEKEYEKYKLDKGDIVIARTGATTGKNYIISDEVESVFASYLIRMKINNRVYNKFISYYMYSDLYWKQIMDEQKGIAQPGVNAQKLGTLIVPLPPLKEQQRIVDRIESLFEKLDKAKELIEEAREGFGKRKAAILEKAFRGELTEKWREDRGIEDQNNLVQLKEVADFKGGFAFKSSEFVEEGIQVIRMGNLYNGVLDLERNPVFVSRDYDSNLVSKYSVKKGDILLTLTGTKYKRDYGYAVLIDEDKELLLNQRILCITTKKSIVTRYLSYYLKSDMFRDIFFSQETGGVNQGNVSGKFVERININLIFIDEQKEIVRILDKLLEEEAKIEELTQLEDQIELIKKSILAKAFRGELGTNCEEDESALELLKEILSKQ